MTAIQFDRDDITAALDELVDRLVARKAVVQVRIVGGAAIAIQRGRATLTADIDALYGGSDDVPAVIAEIATDRNWPPTWLNNAVKMFQSHFDDTADWVTYRERDGVVILLAPSDLLLAMKLLAGRGRRDSADIDNLLDACGTTSRVEAEAIFDRYYPEEVIAAAAAAQLRARFPD